jgi:hypothetical protein
MPLIRAVHGDSRVGKSHLALRFLLDLDPDQWTFFTVNAGDLIKARKALQQTYRAVLNTLKDIDVPVDLEPEGVSVEAILEEAIELGEMLDPLVSDLVSSCEYTLTEGREDSISYRILTKVFGLGRRSKVATAKSTKVTLGKPSNYQISHLAGQLMGVLGQASGKRVLLYVDDLDLLELTLSDTKEEFVELREMLSHLAIDYEVTVVASLRTARMTIRDKSLENTLQVRDEYWKDLLVSHLRVLEQDKMLTVWADRRIAAGVSWFDEIATDIARARAAIILVSADYLASDFVVHEEVPSLLQHKSQEGIKIYAIILRPCTWENISWLSHASVHPNDGRVLSDFSPHGREVELTNIAQEIYTQLRELDLVPMPAAEAGPRRIRNNERAYERAKVIEGPDTLTRDSLYSSVSSILKTIYDIVNRFETAYREEIDCLDTYFEILHSLYSAVSKFCVFIYKNCQNFADDDLCEIKVEIIHLRKLSVAIDVKLRITENCLDRPRDQPSLIAQLTLARFEERITTQVADLFSIVIGECVSRGIKQHSEEKLQSEFNEILIDLNKSGISRYSSVLELLRNQRPLVMQYLTPSASDEKKPEVDVLLRGLWHSFDIVLSEELYGCQTEKMELLDLMTSHKNNNMSRRMREVLRFVRDPNLKWHDVESKLRENIASKVYDEIDRRIFLRSMTLHSTDVTIRYQAVKNIDLRSIWRLLSLSSYPIESAKIITDRVFDDNITFEKLDNHKIIFDLMHDAVIRTLLGDSTETDLIHIRFILHAFSRSDILIEERYHNLFISLLGSFLRMAPTKILDEIDEILVEIGRHVNVIGSSESTDELDSGSFSEATINALDDDVLARLIRKRVYFYYIVTHKSNNIAFRALAHINREPILLSFLRNHHVNKRLFIEVARARRNMIVSAPRAVKAFIENPKARHTMTTVTKIVLRKITSKADRLKLYQNRQISAEVKRMAIRLHRDDKWLHNSYRFTLDY